MPPARSSRRARQPHPRANPYANAAAAHAAATPAPAAPGIPQPDAQPHQPPGPAQLRPNLLLLLPAELRNKIYDPLARKMHRVVLTTTGTSTLAIGRHPLSRTSKQIRSEFLSRVAKFHRAKRYKVTVADFDFGKLMYHLRRNNRLANHRIDYIKIRMTFTTPTIDATKLLTWMKFVQKNSWEQQYEVWGMPPVAVRREFMTRVFRMQEDFGGAWPEIINVVQPLRDFWDRGRGEMKWAGPEEVPPMGEDWERSAGTDVDSSGEESEGSAEESEEGEDV